MASDAKTEGLACEETVDRISNLPALLLDLILEHLPLHDAARTSILSKSWENMTLWIKCISNNGIRKLKIKNKAPSACKIPSYLFSCLGLTHMKLTNCILKPPLSFRGFCNLVRVELVDVIITTDLSFGTQLGDLNARLIASERRIIELQRKSWI
ncbi:F-box/FBD/LRR-repeat protein At1g13570-like [Apium graveolens]|uniref:F-box/FBD/LRR-repeat protein At1g13570-like n=1 Tax=Apium graveolens TaxID=4045 RepID=UPI003D7A4364